MARRQFTACGLAKPTAARWIERGRLHRIYPGVYALGHRRLTERGRLIAALLYAGPGAALTGRSDAAWRGLLKTAPRVVEVASPHRRRSIPGVKVRFRPNLTRELHEGLPVTPVHETLLFLARDSSPREVRRALAEADYKGLLDPPSLRAAIRRRRGAADLNRALSEHLPQLAHARSELEERFIELIESAGLPLPEMNVRIGPFVVDAL